MVGLGSMWKKAGHKWVTKAMCVASLLILLVSGNALAQVGNGAERAAERRAEKQAEKQVEKQVGRKVEQQVEKNTEKQIEKRLEKGLPPGLEKAAEKAGRLVGQDRAKEVRSDKAKAWGKGGNPDKSEGKSPNHTLEVSVEGAYHLSDQWLVLTDKKTLKNLKKQGLEVKTVSSLKGLGQVLVEVKGSPGDLPEDLLAGLSENSDLNHLYEYQAAKESQNSSEEYWLPREALTLAGEQSVPIGLIDSQVESQHPFLNGANIQVKSFIESELVAPLEHGTAIASILVGQVPQCEGLIPEAKLFAASVFYETPELGQAASVKSLLLAMDWMLQSKVKVINMSLAGPPNTLLQIGIEKLQERGIIVVAAAGNKGPTAPPSYPAAYDGVVAVTAVNKSMHAYFKANRGAYIDLAAPGVNIAHADGGSALTSSSGTSYAAPFVAAAFAELLAETDTANATQIIMSNATDIGQTGVDEIYGKGFIHIPGKASL